MTMTIEDQIESIYTQLLSQPVSAEHITKLEEMNIPSLVESALAHKLDSNSIKYLTVVLNEVYNQDGRTFISDNVYDDLYALNKSYNGMDIGGESTIGRMRFKHLYPELRGTIEKCHFITKDERAGTGRPSDMNKKTYEDFTGKIYARTGKPANGKSAIASLKVDGVSGVLHLDERGVVKQALKRGEIIDGVAYGHEIAILNKIVIPLSPEDLPCGHKVEVYMKQDKFEKYVERYGTFDNPRAAITSITNSEEVNQDKLEYVSIMSLESWVNGKSILPPLDETRIRINDMGDFNEVREVVNKLEDYAIKNGIPSDGVVIRIEDIDVQEKLGRKDYINEFEIAYKFPTKEYVTELEDVYFSMGIGGSFTPMAKVKTVRSEIGNVNDVSLNSVPRLIELGLVIGQPVIVTHSTIPYLKTDGNKYEGDPVTIITKCPKCDTDLQYEKSRLFCPNDKCDGRKMGKILKFCVGVGIENIGENTIKDLYTAGIVKEPADLYKINFEAVASLPNYGEKSAALLKASIEVKKDINIDTILGSLSIPDVGRRIFGKMFKHKGPKEIMTMFSLANFTDLLSIKGIGKSIVSKLNTWAANDDNIRMLREILEVVNIQNVKTTASNHSVVFTKVRDKEFAKHLERQGISVLDSYTKEVDVVIYGEKSNKTEKAEKDGKLLLTLEQAYEMYGYK